MLADRIDKDYVTAMKARDTVRASTLSFLRAQIKNARIDRRVERLDDAEVLALIRKQIKQRRDAAEQFSRGGREDLADKEKGEIAVLETYLPPPMSDAELEETVRAAVVEIGAAGPRDMGRVMKLLQPRLAGRADNRSLSACVARILKGGEGSA